MNVKNTPADATALAEAEQSGRHSPPRARAWLTAGTAEAMIIWSALIVLLISSTFASSVFLTVRNILNVAQDGSVLGVLVVALLPLVIAGRFDLSLESTAAFAPMVAGLTVVAPPLGLGTNFSPYLGVFVALGVGAVIGAVNGFLVVRLGLNSFITTLAMLIVLRGATLGLGTGRTIFEPPSPLGFPGEAFIGQVPVSALFAGGLFVALAAFMRYHRIGTSLYAIGGNIEAAREAGIRVERILWSMYVVAGILAAFAGLMLTGYIASVVPSQAQNEIFTVFAALAIGGVSLFGGRGTVLGALAGTAFLAILANILILVGISSFWVESVQGGLIVVALLVQWVTQHALGFGARATA